MEQKDKELLLKDLCARLPYGVKVEVTILETNKVIFEQFDYMWFGILYSENPHHIIKPYLRPMYSMTEEEKIELGDIITIVNNIALEQLRTGDFGVDEGKYKFNHTLELDWLNAHHFDYRGLIKKGLVLEATDGMYNIK